MSHPLPAVPSLDQLRNQAKDLLAAWEAGDPVALARLDRHHPRYRRSEGEAPRSPQLADAQLVLAREYGLLSWAKLREEVRLRMLSFDARAARFVRMAAHSNPGAKNQCWAIANAMLDREPALAKASVHTALVLGDVAAVRERLRSDAGWPVTAGGPGTARQPLLWASFSRLHRRDPAIASGLLECARLLLDHGADVNAGYSAEETGGSVLRPLYGACGAADFPEMAALLIERGAMVDDGESLYHSIESENTRCLDLLLAHGADPRLGNTLAHALDVEGTPRLELLLAAGADPNATLEGQPVLHRAIAFGRGLKAVELLCVLVDRPGEIVGKDEIWQAVWQDTFVEETNLTHNIYLLRKTLKDLGEADLITTVPRRGHWVVVGSTSSQSPASIAGSRCATIARETMRGRGTSHAIRRSARA